MRRDSGFAGAVAHTGASTRPVDPADLLSALSHIDPSLFGEAGALEVIRALERLKRGASALQARMSAWMDELARVRQREEGTPREGMGAGVGTQIALARMESPHRGGRDLGLARALVSELPSTLASMERGDISEWRATLVARETACLDRDIRRAIDERISGRFAWWVTARRFGRYAGSPMPQTRAPRLPGTFRPSPIAGSPSAPLPTPCATSPPCFPRCKGSARRATTPRKLPVGISHLPTADPATSLASPRPPALAISAVHPTNPVPDPVSPSCRGNRFTRRLVHPGSRRLRGSGSAQPLEDQLAHPAGVGLAAHLLHHRADQRTGGRDLAVADLVGDVGVGGDGLVDGRGERAVVGDDRRALGPRRSRRACPRRRAAPSRTWRASLSLSVPSSTSACTRATSAGVTPSAARSVSVSLARRASSPSHHLRAACGGRRRRWSPRRGRARRRRRCRASRGRRSPTAACSRARFSCGGSGSVALSSLDPLAARRHRHQVGLGEVAVVLGVGLLPATGRDAGVLVPVPGLLQDRAAAGEDRGVPLHLVARGPLDRAQRVDVLGLGAGAERSAPSPAAPATG